ncbi:MAG: hypothetical protein RQ952_05840 [Thermoproteota archaeon]|nr:hypothetical protein [Thermoproteota archaeon]
MEKAISEIFSSIINLTLVISLSLVVYLFAYSHFSAYYSNFNKLLDDFNKKSNGNLLIEHAQLIEDKLFIIITNISSSKFYLQSIKILSKSIEKAFVLREGLEPNETKVLSLSINGSLENQIEVIIIYSIENINETFNATYYL